MLVPYKVHIQFYFFVFIVMQPNFYKQNADNNTVFSLSGVFPSDPHRCVLALPPGGEQRSAARRLCTPRGSGTEWNAW